MRGAASAALSPLQAGLMSPNDRIVPAGPRGSVAPLVLVALGWLLPGVGFLLLGRRYRVRAIAYIVTLNLTFALGVALHGGLAWPTIVASNKGSAVVELLNLIMQLGAGLPALVSLSAYELHWQVLHVLARVDVNGYSELGSFYCLVAGALNYFVVWQTLDRREKKGFEILADK